MRTAAKHGFVSPNCLFNQTPAARRVPYLCVAHARPAGTFLPKYAQLSTACDRFLFYRSIIWIVSTAIVHSRVKGTCQFSQRLRASRSNTTSASLQRVFQHLTSRTRQNVREMGKHSSRLAGKAQVSRNKTSVIGAVCLVKPLRQ